MSEITLDPLELFQAQSMVLSNKPPKPVDAVFFHGRSYGDFDGVVATTAELYNQRLANHIALFNTEGERINSNVPFEANPGKTFLVMN